MHVTIDLEGTSPLLCHNIQLADPDNEITRQIKQITAKKTKMTEADRHEAARLEWYGGLYIDGGRPVIPTGNIRKAIIRAGTITRQGTQAGRALQFSDLFVTLTHDGPDDLERLYTTAGFVNRCSVGVGTKRVIRVRPQFINWSLSADAELFEDTMSPDELAAVLRRAGLSEGLGDNRVNGYGRFAGTVRT